MFRLSFFYKKNSSRRSKSPATARRSFHRKAKFDPSVISTNKVYTLVENDIGMPVPTPTDTLFRLTNREDIFKNPFSFVFGFISRQALAHHPALTLTTEHVRKHSLPGHEPNYFLGMSGNRDISLKFKEYSKEEKALIHFDADNSPAHYVDVGRTLGALLPDFSSDTLSDEVEFMARAMLFSSMKKVEDNGLLIDNPFYLVVPDHFKKQFEKFYENYCYLTFKLAAIRNGNDKISAQQATQINRYLLSFINKLIGFYEIILGKKNNPFNLCVAEFNERYPHFVEALCHHTSSLQGKSAEDKCAAFFKSHPKDQLSEVYRRSIYHFFVEFPYMNADNIKNKQNRVVSLPHKPR